MDARSSGEDQEVGPNNRREVVTYFLRTISLLVVFMLPASAVEPEDSAAQMIRDKFGDYHAGDWDAWKSKYADNAKRYSITLLTHR